MTVLAILLAYMAVMVLVGVISMLKTRNVGDFFLGGRNIGAWMSAFAYGTTYFSAVLFIGYAGKLGWGFGLHTMWIVVGNVLVGSLLAWWVLGKRTRDMTVRLNAMTMPEFLAARYGSTALKVAAALLIFVFLVPYSASVYMGLGYLLEKALGIDNYVHVIAMLAGFTGIYLVMGGYFAVTLTDFLMGLLMIFGVSSMLYILVGKAGGFVHATQLLTNHAVAAPALGPAAPGQIPGWVTLASLVVITSLGPWGLPQMVQKFYSIKSSSQVTRAMIVASLFALLITFGGYYTGALTHVNMPDHGASSAAVLTSGEEAYTPSSELPTKMVDGKTTADLDRWMPTFLAQKLPPWMLIVIALLVFSASMSTLSSLVLVSSSAIAIDLYQGVVNTKAKRKAMLILMRVLCAAFILLSLLMALRPPSYIVNLMAISWGVLAGAFAAPYVYGLFWRRANAVGAWAGMVIGVAVGVVLYYILGMPGVPLAGAVAILTPFIVVPVVSALTPAPKKDLIDRAFGTTSEEEPPAEAVEGVTVQ